MTMIWKVLNALGWLGVIAVNTAANAGGLFGRRTGEVSDQIQTLVTPAGYAFAIWGVIYLLLLGFVIAGFLPSQQHNTTLHAASPWFFASCVLNIGWLLVWHSLHYTASVFVMLALLLVLIKLYLTPRQADSSSSHAHSTIWNRVFTALPFSIYLGWISVATIVNIAVALKAANWSGLGLSDMAWAIAVLVVAGVLSLTVAARHSDPWYPLVIAWALIAIGLKQHPVSQAVAITAWSVAAAALLIALLVLPVAWKSLRVHRV